MTTPSVTRDRNNNYIPDGLYLDGRPQFAEISPAREPDHNSLLYLIETAWGVIANVGARTGQGWDWQDPEWKAAATRWRESYHSSAARSAEPTRRTTRDFGWNVDHCHETGIIRGLLCRRCNGGLGWFLDNPEFLRRAADYIEAHRPLRAVPQRRPPSE